MERPSDRCYLLEIPTEVRQAIYDQVIHLDPPTEVSWSFGKWDGSIAKTPDADFSISWVNLLLTSRAINSELQAYLALRRGFDEGNRTWVFETACSSRGLGCLTPATWRQITCPPADIDTLVAKIFFPNPRSRFFGDGGLAPIVSQLHGAFNRIFHYGPAFGRHTPLPQPLKLKTTVLRVSTSPHPEAEDIHDNRFFHSISGFAEMLYNTGVLWGYVDTIRIIDEVTNEEQTLVVSFIENARMPDEWIRYGFGWGATEESVIDNNQ
ncbi:hypothetical protein GQ53DRAFT_829992 [Thozetella sp. PMI_491]|nr:hypothetical protein GQ53DRAFT_829992 [Thozetella sp. PMI_491]